MNKYDYLKELEKLLDEAYNQYLYHETKNVQLASYYKGRFHAFNTAVLILADKGQEA